jgi:predicted nucleotidyltransferase
MIGTDHTKNLEERFPTLAGILGGKRTEATLYEEVRDQEILFHQVESDLQYLQKRFDLQSLSNAFRDLLLDRHQRVQALHEIYIDSLLSSVSDEIKLHVSTNGARNCDFRIKIHGCEIYGDVKTRHDKFPFNTTPIKDDSGGNLYMASRATVDPHVAEGTPHRELAKSIPESTELRQRIENALEQVPETYPNLIIIGLIGDFHFPSKIREEIEAALFGDYLIKFHGSKPIESRHPNGIFNDPRFGEKITSVAWLSLKRSSHGVIRRSGIFFNQNAKHGLPKEIELILERLFDREKSLNRELERIVQKLKESYQPEKIILFGSLAQRDIKEGSDIDLAIIKDTNKRPLDRCLEVARICQPSFAINFVVYTPEEFRMQKEAGNFFVVDEIIERGHVLDG